MQAMGSKVFRLSIAWSRIFLNGNKTVNNDGTRTLERYKKKSFYWYKEVIATNGGSLKKIEERQYFTI